MGIHLPSHLCHFTLILIMLSKLCCGSELPEHVTFLLVRLFAFGKQRLGLCIILFPVSVGIILGTQFV